MAKAPGDAAIADCLREYAFSADTETCEKIREYINLLLRWNERVSLTALADPAEILRFHFGESIYAATSEVIKGGRLADVGSGAGFPGIPLRLALPNLKVTLIEPNLKKSVFLSEVARALELQDVEVVRTRMETFRGGGKYDFITTRALGRVDEFLAFSEARLAESGRVVLWVGDSGAEGLMTKRDGWRWLKPIPIPYSKRRCIVVGYRDQGNVPRETLTFLSLILCST